MTNAMKATVGTTMATTILVMFVFPAQEQDFLLISINMLKSYLTPGASWRLSSTSPFSHILPPSGPFYKERLSKSRGLKF